MAEKEIREENEDGEKWVKHYCSSHQIMLVGEGDFSFSLCLAESFGSASNILATSLDSYDMLTKKYKLAKSNLEKLRSLGASVLHELNATNMKLPTDLRIRKFDRIIFNFPHAGFCGKEDNPRVIRKHQKLLDGFFKNASGMLCTNGEVHVNHKINPPFNNWNLEQLALKNSLAMIQSVDFNIEDYPGYNNKRGDGTRCDEPFPLGECDTFKFIFSRSAKKKASSSGNIGAQSRRQLPLEAPPLQQLQQPLFWDNQLLEAHALPGYTIPIPSHNVLPPRNRASSASGNIGAQSRRQLPLEAPPLQLLQQPLFWDNQLLEAHALPGYTIHIPSHNVLPPRNSASSASGNIEAQSRRQLPLEAPPLQPLQQPLFWDNQLLEAHALPGYTIHIPSHNEQARDECFLIFPEYFDHVGGIDPYFDASVNNALRIGYERYMSEEPGRSVKGYLDLLEELRSLSADKSEWLKEDLVGSGPFIHGC